MESLYVFKSCGART